MIRSLIHQSKQTRIFICHAESRGKLTKGKSHKNELSKLSYLSVTYHTERIVAIRATNQEKERKKNDEQASTGNHSARC